MQVADAEAAQIGYQRASLHQREAGVQLHPVGGPNLCPAHRGESWRNSMIEWATRLTRSWRSGRGTGCDVLRTSTHAPGLPNRGRQNGLDLPPPFNNNRMASPLT